MRKIDWSKPLSDEDRTWAEQRGDMEDDGIKLSEHIRRNDEANGKAQKADSMSRAERMDDLRSTIADAENELSRLQQEQIDEDNQNKALAGSLGDQAKGLIVKDNTPVDGEDPEGSPATGDDYSDERKWTVAALKAEIEKRNEDRVADGVEALPKSGTRAELVERLRQDDAELAQGGE